jgi:CRISPR-associated endonuclease Cas2
MSRPKKKEFTLAERLARIKAAGLQEPPPPVEEDEKLLPLRERVSRMLGIIKGSPLKANDMVYLIMYDISDNKVRTQIAKYLQRQGCIRVQKSVFIARTENPHFQEIHDTLKEVNSYYLNEDSIILAPLNASDMRAMKLIGKNLHIEAITDKPNTLFF